MNDIRMDCLEKTPTVSVIEYESTAYMNLGIDMVANAMRDFTHDSSHTRESK